jgi:hypothetical protein
VWGSVGGVLLLLLLVFGSNSCQRCAAARWVLSCSGYWCQLGELHSVVELCVEVRSLGDCEEFQICMAEYSA